MVLTLYGSFATTELAEKAMGALLDEGVRPEDVSMVANRTAPVPGVVAPIDRQAVVTPASEINRPGDNAIYAEPTPPISPTAIPTSLDTVPAAVPVVDPAPAAAPIVDPVPAVAPVGAPVTPAAPVVDPAPVAVAPLAVDPVTGRPVAAAADPFAPDVVDRATAASESTARAGITTTTGEDAAAGALKGAGIGLALGIAGGLVSIFLPGIGLVIGGGALAAAAAAAAATTGAGMIAGGVTGYLRDQGMPEHIAQSYQDAVSAGGAFIAVHAPSDNVDAGTIERILIKYGATNVARY